MRMGSFLRRVTPLVLSLVFPVPACAQIVINEVLYDPEGSDTGCEFVEIANCGREGVSLTGWVLETGNGASPDDWTVEWVGGDLDYLQPGAILLVGESDVVPAPDYVTALDLQNGPDGLRVTDGHAVVDLVGWGEPLFQEYYEGSPAGDAASGSSLARVPDCFDHDDNSLDFVACSTPTPGLRNVFETDLAVLARHAGAVMFDAGATVHVECILRNEGSLPVGSGEANVELCVDDPATSVSLVLVERSLSPRDSAEVVVDWPSPSPGYHRAWARMRLPGDGDPANDVAETSFTVGRQGGLLVANEIMYSPDEGGTEWIEFVNAGARPVIPGEWLLGDGTEFHMFETGQGDSVAAVAPGCFVLAARDPDVLASIASAECQVLGTDGWEALSADDSVVLLDEFRTPIDRVDYTDDWGGGRGVSLERVRPDVPADDPNNWGSSVAAGGTTPGRRNSIFVEATPAQGRLCVSPNPFSPDGDGSDDRAMVTYDLPVATATVRLSVYDVRGRRRALLLDHAASASRGELLWDGAGYDGAPLPTGLYVVRLEALNARAGILVDEKVAVGLVR
jgi:hypothetical protein